MLTCFFFFCVVSECRVTFADGAAEVRLPDGVGALKGRTLLLTADHVASLPWKAGELAKIFKGFVCTSTT